MPPQPTVPKKRAPPAFKPPRPASKPKPSASTSTSAPTRRKSAPARPPPSFSSSSSDNERDIPDTTDPTATSASQLPLSTQDPPPTIPPKLLTRLLHHHFSSEDIRIGKDANRVVEKYVETFVREALARAAFERAEVGGEGGKRRGDFLEVEDLEKLAPQLILDF